MMDPKRCVLKVQIREKPRLRCEPPGVNTVALVIHGLRWLSSWLFLSPTIVAIITHVYRFFLPFTLPRFQCFAPQAAAATDAPISNAAVPSNKMSANTEGKFGSKYKLGKEVRKGRTNEWIGHEKIILTNLIIINVLLSYALLFISTMYYNKSSAQVPFL